MSDTRITRPRRLFVEAIGAKNQATFSELKDILVGKGEDKIDLTTLYRSVETFKKQGIIHEINHENERIIFLAGENFHPKKVAAELHFCENCQKTSAKYSPLPSACVFREIVNITTSCSYCQ